MYLGYSAQKMRKIMGGGLHQAGMVAAAGLWALDHQVPKLCADHTNARAIAQCENSHCHTGLLCASFLSLGELYHMTFLQTSFLEPSLF